MNAHPTLSFFSAKIAEYPFVIVQQNDHPCLVRAAKLAVSHVPAGLVRHAGELLQLGEVVAVAAVGAVAASSVGSWEIFRITHQFLT